MPTPPSLSVETQYADLNNDQVPPAGVTVSGAESQPAGVSQSAEHACSTQPHTQGIKTISVVKNVPLLHSRIFSFSDPFL